MGEERDPLGTVGTEAERAERTEQRGRFPPKNLRVFLILRIVGTSEEVTACLTPGPRAPRLQASKRTAVPKCGKVD